MNFTSLVLGVRSSRFAPIRLTSVFPSLISSPDRSLKPSKIYFIFRRFSFVSSIIAVISFAKHCNGLILRFPPSISSWSGTLNSMNVRSLECFILSSRISKTMMKMYGLAVSPWGTPLRFLNCLVGYPFPTVEHCFDYLDKIRGAKFRNCKIS